MNGTLNLGRALAAPSRSHFGTRRSVAVTTLILTIGAAITFFPFVWMVL